MPQKPFEIPQQLRRLAEENVEQARQLYLQFMDGVAQAMAMWPASSSEGITPTFHEVRERAVKFAKENADAAFALAREVSQANDLRELLIFRPATYKPRCGGMRIRHRSLVS